MDEAQRTFERLYDEYVDAIFTYIARRLNDRERAKELTHEVYVRLWNQLVAQKPIEHERAFLYTIAKRLFINEIRAPDNFFSLDTLSAQGYDPKDTASSSETTAEAQELWQYITTLSPATQEVLRLRYYDGLPVKEIALILDTAENTVSMRINRALAQLRKMYEQSTTP